MAGSVGAIWSVNGTVRFFERKAGGNWVEVPAPSVPMPESAKFAELVVTKMLAVGDQVGIDAEVKVANNTLIFKKGILVSIKEKG